MKPIVFNYHDYELLLEENARLKDRIEELTALNDELREALWALTEMKDGTDTSEMEGAR